MKAYIEDNGSWRPTVDRNEEFDTAISKVIYVEDGDDLLSTLRAKENDPLSPWVSRIVMQGTVTSTNETPVLVSLSLLKQPCEKDVHVVLCDDYYSQGVVHTNDLLKHFTEKVDDLSEEDTKLLKGFTNGGYLSRCPLPNGFCLIRRENREQHGRLRYRFFITNREEERQKAVTSVRRSIRHKERVDAALATCQRLREEKRPIPSELKTSMAKVNEALDSLTNTIAEWVGWEAFRKANGVAVDALTIGNGIGKRLATLAHLLQFMKKHEVTPNWNAECKLRALRPLTKGKYRVGCTRYSGHNKRALHTFNFIKDEVDRLCPKEESS